LLQSENRGGKKKHQEIGRRRQGQEARQEKKIGDLSDRGRARMPPAAKFFHELVVGNGIGEHAVEDATEAYRKAWESRREKALAAAQKHEHESGKNCTAGEHL